MSGRESPDQARPWLPQPAHALAAGLGFVALVWLLFLFVDLGNVAGAREFFEARSDFPVIWHRILGGWHSVGGLLHWSLLGALIVCGGMAAGALARDGDTAGSRFWLLLVFAATLLLIQDPGKLRAFFGPAATRLLGPAGWTLSELGFFVVTLAAPLVALFLYGRSMEWARSTAVLLGVGMLLYGATLVARLTVSLGSGTRDVQSVADGGWLLALGGYIDEVVLRGRLLRIPDYHHWYEFPEITGYLLMDDLVLGTFELTGITLVLAACLSYYRYRSSALATQQRP